jgi:cellulose synthase/poly-beta-1,6-N-acetylglucosamine synthase-like glycosyltransferase
MPSLAIILELLLTTGLIILAVMSLHLTTLSVARLLLARRQLPDRLAEGLIEHRLDDDALPDVLIQIPLYNEGDLIERILTSVTALDWPARRLHIQVLDDSTDGISLAASRAAVDALARQGWQVTLQHRAQRTAFKAGALAEGLARCDAPYVAIFDVDFLPPPDFLRRTVGVLLADEGMAYVQTRWLHANREHNLLTRAQGRLLDGHFLVEQESRLRLGLPVPFNGTGGVWRRAAIDDAGGWHGDTLTEDLDLSLRARLRGWRSGYLADLGVPGILPESPRAWRTQQFRWTKGFIECLVKLAPDIWRSDRLPRWQKLLITLQLTQPLAFLVGFASILCGLPFIAGTFAAGPVLSTVALGTASIGLLGPISVLTIGAWGAPPLRILREGAIALFLTSGLMLSNTRAALEALVGRRSDFIRTPKRTELPVAGAGTRPCRCGLLELAAGGGLFTFVLLEHPLALLPMALAIGGLLGFGLMQIDEQASSAPQITSRAE